MATNKVFLAVPTMGWVRTSLMLRIIPWMSRGTVPIFFRPTDEERPAPRCRNMLVKEFLESDCTHFFCVDHDTTPPADALELLLAAGVPAISGIVHQMRLDDDGVVKPVGMVARKDEKGGYKAARPIANAQVVRIDACGSACVLYEREVFETLEFPWYEEKPWGDSPGSDWVLAEKMAEAGIKLFAHFGVFCLHRKELDF